VVGIGLARFAVAWIVRNLGLKEGDAWFHFRISFLLVLALTVRCATLRIGWVRVGWVWFGRARRGRAWHAPVRSAMNQC
jgi:hypothetical protein